MSRDFTLIVVCYICALAAAALTLPFVREQHLLVQILAADVVATVVVFVFSVIFRNSSFYDAYWSVAPIVIAGYLLWLTEILSLRAALVSLVVVLWGVRLTANWAYGWQGLGHEDWRYVDLKQKSGLLWWPLSFVGIHLFPTLIVMLGCVSLYPAIVAGAAPVNWLDGVALVVGVAAVALEYQADVELHRFRATRSSRQQVLTTGVWGWCRHPNYLGEIGFWVSLYLFGHAALGGSDWWMRSGPLAMIGLFVVISIPMIEIKLARDKPEYDAYRRRSFALLPLSWLR